MDVEKRELMGFAICGERDSMLPCKDDSVQDNVDVDDAAALQEFAALPMAGPAGLASGNGLFFQPTGLNDYPPELLLSEEDQPGGVAERSTRTQDPWTAINVVGLNVHTGPSVYMPHIQQSPTFMRRGISTKRFTPSPLKIHNVDIESLEVASRRPHSIRQQLFTTFSAISVAIMVLVVIDIAAGTIESSFIVLCGILLPHAAY
ncbi:hypothetical protein MMC13_003404 [Lambiella insularis]|nr:hypothetical protein [Lambiella insularis]